MRVTGTANYVNNYRNPARQDMPDLSESNWNPATSGSRYHTPVDRVRVEPRRFATAPADNRGAHAHFDPINLRVSPNDPYQQQIDIVSRQLEETLSLQNAELMSGSFDSKRIIEPALSTMPFDHVPVDDFHAHTAATPNSIYSSHSVAHSNFSEEMPGPITAAQTSTEMTNPNESYQQQIDIATRQLESLSRQNVQLMSDLIESEGIVTQPPTTTSHQNATTTPNMYSNDVTHTSAPPNAPYSLSERIPQHNGQHHTEQSLTSETEIATKSVTHEPSPISKDKATDWWSLCALGDRVIGTLTSKKSQATAMAFKVCI